MRYRSKRRLITMAIVAFIVTLGFCASLVYMWERSRLAELRNAVTEVGVSKAYSLSSQLDRSLSAAYALASLIKEYGDIKNFENLAADMIDRYGGISSLQLAPSGIVRNIYPLEGNEAAIGHDLLNDLGRRTEALAAIQSGEMTLAGPFELVQGGTAVIGRYPVFLTDEQSDTDKFWGFTIVLIKLDELLSASSVDQLVASGYHYELSRKAPDTLASQIIAMCAHEAIMDLVAIDVNVPNGNWSLALAPQRGWYSLLSVFAEATVAVFLSLIIALLYYQRMNYMGELLHKNRLLNDEVKQRKLIEDNLKKSEEKFSKAFHASPDSVTITTLEEGRLIEVNEGFEKAFGYSSDEALGKTPFELNIYSDPNYRQYMLEILQGNGSIQGFYAQGVRKSGEVRDCLLSVEKIVINGTPHLVTIARDVTDLKLAEEKKDELILKLQEALSEIKTLNGLLPICSCCKKIRDDNGYWNQIEVYIRDRSDADFSHGICPDCAKEVYPDHYKKILGVCSENEECKKD